MIDEVLETVNAAAYEVTESQDSEDLNVYLVECLELYQSYYSLFEEDSILCYLPYKGGMLTVKTFSKIR